MIYLLDTDIMIFMARGLKSTRRPAQRQRAQELVEQCRKTQSGGDSVGLSAVTISELEFDGQIRHELEAKGVTIGSMDLLIAAHALALDATLVSNNLAHFSRVTGLRTANWVPG